MFRINSKAANYKHKTPMNYINYLLLSIISIYLIVLVPTAVYGQSADRGLLTQQTLPIKKNSYKGNFSLVVRKLLNKIHERSSIKNAEGKASLSEKNGTSKLIAASISRRLQENIARKISLSKKKNATYKKYSVQKGSEKYRPERHSLKELRDRYIIKQQSEYSCSAAALATLLTYYFGDETSEIKILTMLEKQLTDEERSSKHATGFSLFDLKNVVKQLGYQAGGFKLKLEQLELLSSPVIVYVDPLDFEHFAVLRGVKGGHVFLADPSRGNLKMTITQFADEWDGIVFVVGKKGEGDITSYPLKIAQSGLDQPELINVSRMHEIVSSSFAR